jgi:hypothetical protein
MAKQSPEKVIEDLIEKGHILITRNGEGWAVNKGALPLPRAMVELWQKMGREGKLPPPPERS